MSRFEGRNIRRDIEERLALNEFRLLCEEFINRSDSTEQIGVSITRVSKGLHLYIKNVPGDLEYETSTKRHLASTNFQPILLVAHTDAHLTQLLNATNSDSEEYERWLVTSPDFDLMPTHYWRVRVNVMRLTLLAIHDERVIEVERQSVSAQYPVFEWRWNTPHALDHDGLRWHVRTYCHIDKKFKDSILFSCFDTHGEGKPAVKVKFNILCQKTFEVSLVLSPMLNDAQRVAITQDYEMIDG